MGKEAGSKPEKEGEIMKLILIIIAVTVAVAYVGSYIAIVHFLKQSVDKMQKIQEKERKEK